MAVFEESKWIWAEDNRKQNDRVVFRRTVTLEKVPKNVTLYAYARDSFSLFVNGKPVALGVKRCAAYDITKLLSKGENVFGFDCLHYGLAANGCALHEESGLIVACPAIGVYSDCEFRAMRPFSQDDGEPRPSGRFWGFNTYTDGGRGEIGNVFDPEFDSTLFTDAEEFESAEDVAEEVDEESTALLTNAYLGLQKVKRMEKETNGATVIYTVDLGGEKICYPVVELSAMGTERLEIKSDRYKTSGREDDAREYFGVRSVYVCRNGAQRYVSPIAFCGSKLILEAPNTVAVKSVDLRVTAFKTERVLELDTNERVGKLIDKCDNTMRACMDGGILDNTDRDRGCDLFALSLFTRSALYTYDDSILPLIKDALLCAAAGENGKLVNYPYSPLCEEDPIASLLFCSSYGGIAAYYYRTGDEELLEKTHATLCEYLLQWGELHGGKLTLRKGGKGDAGYNIDRELIAVCLYYSAARFLLETSFASGNTDYAEELQKRAEQIAATFENNYYGGEYYTSGKVCDERANALAVLTGLVDESHTDSLVRVLAACNNCSPAYEGFVIEALGVLGEGKRAVSRLLSRYTHLIDSESTVLPESFTFIGSQCSALSVSPISAYLAGVCGLRYTGAKAVTFVPPEMGDEKFVAPLCNGSMRFVRKGDGAVIDNASGEEIDLLLSDGAKRIGKGKTKI
ncbi:MAG: hypothetical protein K2M95_04265 [Clostridiales bacterium]|nr:hypothetical protein [Clostridiales bacterium]